MRDAPPESIALPLPRICVQTFDGIRAYLWIECEGCFVMEFAGSLTGPWVQEGPVLSAGTQLVELPAANYVGRYWRARAVPCEAPEPE